MLGEASCGYARPQAVLFGRWKVGGVVVRG